MPPSRILRRYSIGRRPSSFPSDLIRPGIYGASPSPRSVTFAPNVTPGTYKDPDDLTLDTEDECPLLPDAQLFPPSEEPPNPSSKRRAPPGKRRSLGYIPRPPNAFMLFRADFVRQKHVPGSIETNHGSLSKIIGNCWRALPLEEKRIWEIKAKQEKEAHSKKYPGYRFRPVHNKDKPKKKDKSPPTAEDERRCEEVAQLLLEGMKGDDLAAAIRKLDEKNISMAPPACQPAHQPIYPPRRPSSVPLPDSRFHPIALPSVPFFAPASRSASPVHNIARSARMIIGQRRPSSAQPYFGRTSWGVDDIPMFPSVPAQGLYSDESPLPAVNTSLFDPTFLDSNFGFQSGSGETIYHDIFSTVAPNSAHVSESPTFDFPIDQIAPQDLSLTLDCVTATQMVHDGLSGATWQTPMELSASSSTYSDSPAHSELSLPLIAPRPQHAQGGFDVWPDMHVVSPEATLKATPSQMQGLSITMGTQHLGVAVAGVDVAAEQMQFEEMFDAAFTGMPGY